MSDFGAQLRAFNAKQQRMTRDLFVNVAAASLDAIQNGSSVTGSPGQLVRSGNLKASFQLTFPSASIAEISTNVIYARQMEEGTRDGKALTQRSTVGGFHSIAKLITGFSRLVQSVAAKRGGAS